MKEKKNWLGKVVLLIAVIAAVAVYFLVPGVNKMMNKVFAMFASGDFTVVRDFVASYGAYAACNLILLMIFQSICSTASGILLTFANCESVWMVAGSNPFLDKCYGRSSCMFLHCKEFWDVMWQRNLQARATGSELIRFLNDMERIQS